MATAPDYVFVVASASDGRFVSVDGIYTFEEAAQAACRPHQAVSRFPFNVDVTDQHAFEMWSPNNPYWKFVNA